MPSFIKKLSGEANDVSDVKSMYKIMIDDVYELMNAMYKFQYKFEYYVLSREFITYCNYIERFYYILILNICDKAGIKNIYIKIFIEECSTKFVDGIKQINVLQKYAADVKEAYDVARKNLTLDDSSYSLPDCLLVTKCRSIIGSYCVGDLPNNTNTACILIFRPYQYIEDMLSLDITNINKFKLIIELL